VIDACRYDNRVTALVTTAGVIIVNDRLRIIPAEDVIIIAQGTLTRDADTMPLTYRFQESGFVETFAFTATL
jgi:folate-dependent tRNA-U54 methylase TrmFO/GidA